MLPIECRCGSNWRWRQSLTFDARWISVFLNYQNLESQLPRGRLADGWPRELPDDGVWPQNRNVWRNGDFERHFVWTRQTHESMCLTLIGAAGTLRAWRLATSSCRSYGLLGQPPTRTKAGTARSEERTERATAMTRPSHTHIRWSAPAIRASRLWASSRNHSIAANS